MPTMSRTDRRTWAGARALTDLGELTAQWLEGRIGSQPGYVPNCGPDDETRELIPALAAANRAGYLTTDSQPGSDGPGHDGRRWQQRAAVQGFATPTTLARLRHAAARHGLLIADSPVPATTRDGRVVTAFGGRMHDRDLRNIWSGVVSRDAYQAVKNATQVAVVCPDWGPGGTRKLLAVLAALG